MVVNLCYVDYAATNIAEHFTQPIDYFEFHDEVKKVPLYSDVSTYLDQDLTLVIVGGGGIAGGRGWQQIQHVVKSLPTATPVVIWGMGINEHGRLDRHYNDALHYLEQRPNVLIGLRDCFYKTYVACASCLRPEFDSRFRVEHEIVFYAHHEFSDLVLPCPTMSNRVEGNPLDYFQRVIAFLGSADIVVTNTYHGAYWATLLNRNVVVVAPFSNKFMGLRYEPVIVQDVGVLSPMLKDASRRELARHLLKRFPMAAFESRESNRRFYRQVTAFRKSLA
jgi:hypothetical protein